MTACTLSAPTGGAHSASYKVSKNTGLWAGEVFHRIRHIHYYVIVNCYKFEDIGTVVAAQMMNL